MPYATATDGTRLYYKDWGVGRPVIFVHGWPFSADMWDAQMIAVANAGYRAIAYDRRGFGRSDQPWNGYEFDTLSDDLATIIAATRAQDATLVGFSMGGGELARYMSRHGGKSVDSLVFLATIFPIVVAAPGNEDGVPPDALQGLKAGILDDRPTTLRRGFLPGFFGVDTPAGEKVTDDVLEAALDVALQAGTYPMAAAIDAMPTDFRAEISAITVPTLLLHGTADVSVPIVTSRAAAKALPDVSTLIEYEGHAHAVYVTARDQVNADLLEFLRRVDGKQVEARA